MFVERLEAFDRHVIIMTLQRSIRQVDEALLEHKKEREWLETLSPESQEVEKEKWRTEGRTSKDIFNEAVACWGSMILLACK